MSPDTTYYLIQKLAEPYSIEQEQAIEQLISMGRDAVKALIDTVNSNQGRQSWLAAKALSHIEDDRVVPGLTANLPALSTPLQSMIVELLGRLQDKRAVPALLQTLESTNAVVQMATIQALRHISDSQVIEALLKVLDSTESHSIRYTIVETLGDIGDSRVIEPIRKYQNDENHHVKKRVQRALEKLSKSSVEQKGLSNEAFG